MARKRINYTNWTPRLDMVMYLLFPTYPTEHVAEIMGMSVCSINGRANLLNLKKDPKYLQEIKECTNRSLHEHGIAYRFPKGHVPQNKGKKMPPELRAKVESTFFKKGQKPHNTKFDGYERINSEGYTEVRMAERVFVPKHRLIWKQHYGRIPEGHIIIFADGDRRNFAIENLVCVSRGDHAILNKNKKYGPEIAQNALLLSKLRNQLNIQK